MLTISVYFFFMLPGYYMQPKFWTSYLHGHIKKIELSWRYFVFKLVSYNTCPFKCSIRSFFLFFNLFHIYFVLMMKWSSWNSYCACRMRILELEKCNSKYQFLKRCDCGDVATIFIYDWISKVIIHSYASSCLLIVIWSIYYFN